MIHKACVIDSPSSAWRDLNQPKQRTNICPTTREIEMSTEFVCVHEIWVPNPHPAGMGQIWGNFRKFSRKFLSDYSSKPSLSPGPPFLGGLETRIRGQNILWNLDFAKKIASSRVDSGHLLTPTHPSALADCRRAVHQRLTHIFLGSMREESDLLTP